MIKTVVQNVRSFFNIVPEERLKIWLLSLALFLIIGAYTLATELKNSIFIQIVGTEYIPTAKIYSMFFLVPLILFYSRLVDSVRRYQLMYIYTIAFGLLGLLFAYFLSHPTIGIPNTQTSPYRIFGWLFFFFVEAYAPFVLSVFWSFANSINSPGSAKRYYALVVGASKLGGMLTAVLAWGLLVLTSGPGCYFITDTINHQLILGFSSLLLLFVPVVIYFLMKWVPGHYLHGYEAVYQFEKQKDKQEEKVKITTTWYEDIQATMLKMVSGLTMFVKQPYVLGIFGMTFFYEVVYVVFSYLRIAVAKTGATGMSDVTCALFGQIFFVHATGFVISVVGTQALLNKLGERRCLLLIPAISGLFLIMLLISFSPATVFIGFVGLRALNFGFSQPIRESLYIPTVKDLKFKSKSWIDAFGSKLARSTGSSFNMVAPSGTSPLFVPLYAAFFATVLCWWFVTAYLLGKRFEKAIANNEVIGSKDELIVV